jgi:hypothetical protein
MLVLHYEYDKLNYFSDEIIKEFDELFVIMWELEAYPLNEFHHEFTRMQAADEFMRSSSSSSLDLS